MNRHLSPGSDSHLFVEALEPRIAPAGLLNETKFTSITAGGTVLLDASDPSGFQGISTGFGAFSGTYLLYITAGKALVYTSDLNGNGRVDFNEITGIAAGVDAQGRGLDLISFANINGDIATNLLPGTGVSALTDSDNNPNNGRDGRVLLDNGIHSITLRTLNASDIDTTVPGNTLSNRLGLTSFSITGNIYTGADFGAADGGLTIDISGAPQLANKFNGVTGTELYTGSVPFIGGVKTGTAANYQPFHFAVSSSVDIQGTFLPFTPKVGEHGGDIIGVKASAVTTSFDIGVLETGSGGANARGGDMSLVVLHGDRGTYSLVAGDGGQGAVGGKGGSIIDFNDLGTVNSATLIHTGAGGVGLLGAGGQAGSVTFGSAQTAAHVQISLGDGGAGFTAGGNGAGQPTASFQIPEGGVPVGGLFQGTYHEIGDIGNMRYTGTNGAGQFLYAARAIDFDGDGFGDVVYSSRLPDQLVLLFGDGAGGFNPAKTIYLDAPGTSQNTFVVADFNGDGKPDVAAASADTNNFGGVHVFLNQIGDSLRNPLGGKIYTFNPLGNHPFSTSLESPLPTLSDIGLFQGRDAVFSIAAGDFNGDGIMDVGIAHNLTSTNGGQLRLNRFVSILFGDDVRDPDTGARILDPVTGRPEGAGYFVANLVAPGQPAQLVARLVQPVGERAILQASNTAVGSGLPDELIYGLKGQRTIYEVRVAADPNTHVPFGEIPLLGALANPLGQVDTNRAVGQLALQAAVLQDYTLVDLNADGTLDVVTLLAQPVNFLVTMQGTSGPAGFGLTVASFLTLGSSDNLGIKYPVFNDGSVPLTITPVDFNVTADANTGSFQDGIFNQFAIQSLTGTPQTAVLRELSLEVAGVPDFYAAGAGVAGLRSARTGLEVADDVVTGAGAYYPVVGTKVNPAFPLVDRPVSGYGLLATNTDNPNFDLRFTFAPLGTLLFGTSNFLTDNGIIFKAGNGGDSTAGVAGSGGTLGTGLLGAGANGVPAGSIEIVYPAYLAYHGRSTLTSGDGGNGFGGGGAGGDATGVTTRFVGNVISTDTKLNTGNGGDGISGDGGRGGDIFADSLDGGSQFLAGNGGDGLRGGRGGTIRGNGSFFDARGLSVYAAAGSGGVGALAGGEGGGISNFNTTFTIVLGVSDGGSLLFTTGAGGNAAAGIGGNGGAILNSSPDVTLNTLSQVLVLSTGIGGDGLSGGVGGAITGFRNQPTASTAIPFQLSVLTGHGGIGVVGAGGAGGTITDFRSNALGQLAGVPDLVRIIAGAGGASYGSVGGVGGSVINTISQSVSAPIAVTAGAGGAGITSGGDGGTVRDSTFNSASQTLGKVLIIAGAGGDVSGVSNVDVFVPNDTNTNDLAHILLAFGGVSGIGGNGGNITNVTQPISVQSSVDIIAGNGGSTLNYGSSVATSSGAGVGGSVINLNLFGTVGTTMPNAVTGNNPPIRSYVDTDGNGIEDVSLATYAQSLGGTINTTLLDSALFDYSLANVFVPSANYNAVSLAAGNVGIVAGASGRVQGGAPPRGGVNGSVQNISASSFMSIVANSVDNVARVQLISGLTLKNIDGVFGADKSLADLPPFGGPNNIIEYFDLNGRVVQNLEPGYKLIDGAIFAQTITQPAVPPNIAGPRVFAPMQN